jgi:hypothetical protein
MALKYPTPSNRLYSEQELIARAVLGVWIPRPITRHLRAEVLALYARGEPRKNIARLTGRQYETVRKIIRVSL